MSHLQGQGFLLPFPSLLFLSLGMSFTGVTPPWPSAGPPSFPSRHHPSPRAFSLSELQTLPSADSCVSFYLVLSWPTLGCWISKAVAAHADLPSASGRTGGR